MANELLAEKFAIAELISRYNRVIDRGDFQGWADCFTADGVFNGAYDSFRAHGELDRFRDASRKIMADAPNLRHYVTNIESDIDGDRAAALGRLLMRSRA